MKTVLLISALLLSLAGCSTHRTSVAVYVEGYVPQQYTPFPTMVRAEYRLDGPFGPPAPAHQAQR